METITRWTADMVERLTDHDELTSIEHHVRELNERALEAARERAACEAAVARAREALASAQHELPAAERHAKEQRQAQNDAIRGRAELEHRLAELVEQEDLTRQRRQQAEQRAQGFRAAGAFATAGRAEAATAGDNDRVERERLVEDRATREAVTAEARAAEELAEETKLARHRSEIETHVDAERSLEAEIAADRASSEARVITLRETIESASFEAHEAEVNLGRLDAARERLAQERAIAGERLRELGKQARTDIEARIADLRAKELEIAQQREEQERLLAAIDESERALEPQPPPIEIETVAEAEEASDAAAQPQAAAEPAAEMPASPSPEPHFSTMSFTTMQPHQTAPQRQPEAETSHGADDRSGVRSLMGNSLIGSIFTRRKPIEEPVEDEGPSIADRIARDFGLLGTADEDAAQDGADAPRTDAPPAFAEAARAETSGAEAKPAP